MARSVVVVAASVFVVAGVGLLCGARLLWAVEDPGSELGYPVASLVHSAPRPTAGDTLTAHLRRRAQGLLRDRVACLGCHSLQGEGGAIGPSLDGVGSRLGRDFVARMIQDPQATMPGSNMPGQPLQPRDIGLLADLLTEGEPWSGATPAPIQAPIEPPDTTGPGLYQRHCSSCHGAAGAGDGWNAANLPVPPTDHTDATAMSARVDDTLYDAIHAGGWVLDKSPRMPAFGALLTPPQIRALVAHIRTLCECSAPIWSRDGAEVGVAGADTTMARDGR